MAVAIVLSIILSLQDISMLKIIQNNPYRFFGVCSNSSTKDRIANANKLKAYLKVGRSVDFAYDFENILDHLDRSLTGLGTANSSINLPQDQIKYALFWFIKDSPIDQMALEYLSKDNSEKAIELFNKKESFSSLINRGVVAFIQEDYANGIACITKVIHNDVYRDSFIKAVCGDSFTISEEELAMSFINSLADEIPINQLSELFNEHGSSENDAITLNNLVINEYIANINAAITDAKGIDRNDAKAQYNAGISLMKSTKEPLAALEEHFFTGEYVMETYAMLEIGLPLQLPRKVYDQQYVFIADNLAKQILQCGINYFNNSKEEIERRIDKARTLQSYALSIAVGKLTRERCKENVNILDERKENLPPKEARYYDGLIQKALKKYSSQPQKIGPAVKLIETCIPYLMSIKETLGDSHPFYLKASTLIVNAALSNVIEEFNSTMNNDVLKLQLSFDRAGAISTIRDLFERAWAATLLMDKLDMEPDFKSNRYKTNRDALKNQVKDLINIYAVASLDMRSESQYFSDCKSISDCYAYMSVFPKGKYTSEVEKRIERLEFDDCKTPQDCQKFLEKYPNTIFNVTEKREECFFKTCKTIQQYEAYCDEYPRGKYLIQAKAKIDSLSFQKCSKRADFQAYLANFPNGGSRAKAQAWIDEEDLWQRCLAADTKELYKEYLSKYPNGRYKSTAEPKAKACYIATMVYEDYDHPQVKALRTFRDEVLYKTYLGQSFIAFYYRHSPALVKRLQNHKIINRLIRYSLDLFIKIIR